LRKRRRTTESSSRDNATAACSSFLEEVEREKKIERRYLVCRIANEIASQALAVELAMNKDGERRSLDSRVSWK